MVSIYYYVQEKLGFKYPLENNNIYDINRSLFLLDEAISVAILFCLLYCSILRRVHSGLHEPW